MQTALTKTNITLLALDVDEALTLHGGCTLDPITGNKPTTGIAVAVQGAERQYRRRPSIGQIRSWINRTARPLLVGLDARGYRPHLGAWIDKDGTTYLDVSIIVDDLDTALKLGKQWGQKAVFNLATHETYFIE